MSLTGINFISAKQCQCSKAETRSFDMSHSSNANVSSIMVNHETTENLTADIDKIVTEFDSK